MARELNVSYNDGSVLYAIIRRASDGKVWNGSAFVTWADADIATYDVALTPLSGDFYAADFPSAIDTGTYFINYYVRAGATPAISDTLLNALADTIDWVLGGATTGAGTGLITVSEATSWVRTFARNAGDSTEYTDAQIHRAIQQVGNDFLSRVWCSLTQATITITADDPAVDFSGVTGFFARRLTRAWVDDQPPLRVVPHQDVLDNRRLSGTASYQPLLIGFITPTSAEVWPTPTENKTLTYVYRPFFTSWTPGTTPSITLNIPDDYLQPCLTYGVTAVLQHNEPQHKYASESWKKYEEHREMCRSEQLGTRVMSRASTEEVCRGDEEFVEGGVSY
jgi:hypothetical protein